MRWSLRRLVAAARRGALGVCGCVGEREEVAARGMCHVCLGGGVDGDGLGVWVCGFVV